MIPSFVVAVALFTLSCKTLELSIENPSNEESYGIYLIKEHDNKPIERIGLGSISPNESFSYEYRFKRSDRIRMEATKNSYTIWKSPEYTMEDNKKDELLINTNLVSTLDTRSIMAKFTEDEKRFGQYIEAEGARSINSALQTDFGAFFVREANKENSPYIRVVPPHYYEGGLKSLEWLESQQGEHEESISERYILNRAATAQLSTGHSLFEVNASFTGSSIYEYGVKIDIISYKHPETFYTALVKLRLSETPGAKEAYEQLSRMLSDSRYEVLFVEELLFIKEFSVSYKRGKRISNDVDLTVQSDNIYFEGDAAFAIDNSSMEERESKRKNSVSAYKYSYPVSVALNESGLMPESGKAEEAEEGFEPGSENDTDKKREHDEAQEDESIMSIIADDSAAASSETDEDLINSSIDYLQRNIPIKQSVIKTKYIKDEESEKK